MGTKEQAIELVNNMNEQSNRGTASPYYYEVQVNKADYARNSNDAQGSYVLVFVYDYKVYDIDEARDYMSDCKERDCSECDDYDVEDWFISRGAEKMYRWYEYKTYHDCGTFLTEKGAQAFIESNRHHVGDDARTYVRHFWRNGDMKLINEILGEYTGIKIQEY